MDAVDRGEWVFWQTLSYPVHKDHLGQYFIGQGPGQVGLTWADGITLNGRIEDFFVLSEDERATLFQGTRH
ncbi:hypothetical protein [Thioalkalivibrio thiocyanoxidans]|uniref:hypothetical protein n=1 Tax=Thioalkalivibrio thiocyanoxidans TaxID=152475 RepID=UPI000379E916|nr:hypothetical protein [Thioalkalivibrio thiocyanoxidans]